MSDFLNNILNAFSSVYDTSHVKTKIIGTVIALILLPLIKRFILTPIINKIKDNEKRYKWNKAVSYIYYFLFIFIISFVIHLE